MFGLILLLTFAGFVGIWLWRIDGGISIIVPVLIVVIFAVPVIAITGGLLPDYSTGVRDGYVTKLSTKGVVWKTHEGELQVGSGNMAALQEPFEFSVKNSTLLPSLKDASTHALRVRLHYQEYLVPNVRYGESSYLITQVEVLGEVEN